MTDTLRKTVTAQVTKAGPGRTFRFVLSTATEDRVGDVIEQAGWDLRAFRRNPVVLWAHDYGSPPVGRATSIDVENGVLRATVEPPPRGVYPFADEVFALVENGFLNAVSVGFAPLEWEPRSNGGRRFTRAELLEFSIVAVPALAEALIESRSHHKVDRARVDAWLRTGTVNPDDVVLVVEGQPMTARALRSAVEGGVREARRRLNAGADTVRFDAADLKAALAAALDTLRPQIVSELNRALGRVRGRLD